METTFKINNIISISLNEYLDNPDLVNTLPPSRYHAIIDQAIGNQDAIEFDLCKRDFSEAFIRELVGDYLTKHGMNVVWTINFINSNNNMRILIDEILMPQLNKFWESVGNISDEDEIITNATSTITIDITSEQKAKFLALGGAEWLRKILSKNEK